MSPNIEILNRKIDLTISKHTMNEREVLDLLGTEFPSLNKELERVPNGTNIYKAIQCFADLTKSLVNKQNFKEVKHCFRVAEKMLQNGNGIVKNAIENCYVSSVTGMLDFAGATGNKTKRLLTNLLKKEYTRQVCAAGV